MIDFSKPVQTVDGRSVEIITTTARKPHCVLGYIGDDDEVWSWTESGEMFEEYPAINNLKNVPEKIVTYHNVYYSKDSKVIVGTGWCTEAEAHEASHYATYIKTIKVEV